MKIGLIDVDGHNYPNLALMKISAWQKSQEHHVEWCDGLSYYDVVFKSKVFTFSTVSPITLLWTTFELKKGKPNTL